MQLKKRLNRLAALLEKPMVFWGLILLLMVFRMFLSTGIRYQLHSQATHDDLLQISKTMSIVNGGWLGGYTSLTLVKGVGYPLLAALFHVLHIPVVQAWHGLFLLSGLLFMQAVKPLATARWQQLVCFCLIVFSPIAFSVQITRLYRDIGYYIISLFCVALFLGLLLRAPNEKLPWGYALGAGLSLGFALLFREDSQWLYIYGGACVLVFLGFRILTQKRIGVKMLMAPILCATGVCAMLLPVCTVNYVWYGTFVTDEYNSGPYAKAYGALTRFDGGLQDSTIPIPQDMRMYLYEHSPAFAELYELLDAPDAHFAGWKYNNEYRTGYFSFNLRDAAWFAGKYKDSATANAYFTQLAEEVNRLADEAPFETGPRRSGIHARFYPNQIGDIVSATFQGLWATLRCEGIDARPIPIGGEDFYIERFSGYARSEPAAVIYYENGDIVENYHPTGLGKWMMRGCRAIVYGWKLLFAPLFLSMLVGFVATSALLLLRRKSTPGLWLHMLGVLSLACAVLLRAAMVGYVHATSFSAIFTPSYQAATYVLVSAFAASGFLFICRYLPQCKRNITQSAA